jgi:hypothetical protein
MSWGASEVTARTARTGTSFKSRSNFNQPASSAPMGKLYLKDSDFATKSGFTDPAAPSSFAIPDSGFSGIGKTSALAKGGRKLGKSDYSNISQSRQPLKLSPDNLFHLTHEGSEAPTSLFQPPESTAPGVMPIAGLTQANLQKFRQPRLPALEEASEPDTASSMRKRERRRTAMRGAPLRR